jgi:uncharacterized protein with HEPN domain
MNENDLVRLRHMRDSSLEVVGFVKDESREALNTDIKLVRALCMSIGIIGEAAVNVSHEVRQANPQIPWRSVIGMRNFLFHGYFKIDLNVVWITATENVPSLLIELERLLEGQNKNDNNPINNDPSISE